MRNTDMETIILCCLVLSTLAPDPSTVDNLQPTTPGAGPDNSYSITPYDPNNHNTTAGNKFNYVLRLKSQKEVEEINIKTDIVALTQKNLSDWTLDELFHYFQVVQLIECNKQCIEETNIPVETLNISLMRRNGFECQPCYCDESCHVSGDCCTLATHTLPEQDKFQCIVTINQTKMEKSVLTKMSCADNYHDKRIRELCKMPSSGCSMLPVTAQSGITYLNKYCAICNYESKYKEWQLDMRGENMVLSSRVLELFSCENDIYIKQSSFDQQMETKTRECNRFMIQTCKINTSKILETNCQQHYGPIYRPDVGMFKNVFCFLCNGFDFRGEYLWVSNTEFGGFVNRVSYPNLSDLFDRTYTSSVAGMCNSSVDWFHPYQRRCYQIECSPQLQLQDGECLPIQNDLRTVYHTLFTIDDVFYKAQMDLLANKIKEDLQTLRITTYVTYVGIQDYSNNSFIHVYFFLEKSRFRNLTQIVSFIKDNWKFGEQVTHDSTVSQQSRSISHEIVSDDVLLTCCKKDKIAYFNRLRTHIVELNKQYICPHIVQDYLEFEDGLNGSLTLYNTSLTLNKGEYYMDQQNSVTVCIDTINDKWKSSLYQENIIFIILRIRFLVLSLLSLFITFLTYCTFPILRTSASKNNMALVVCLFLAQLFLLIGSFQATNDIMCKITGMLIHYSWLCVVFWMNVCSFHMFSVFRLSTVSRIPSSAKRLIKYTLYANGLPLIIVAMVISSFSIIYGTLGYGGRKCYLETPLLVGVAFILPLALVIICNFIFLSLTIISINKTSNNARLVGKDQHHIMVYIKLSTLTGIFWTVDILSNFFLHDILSVLSTILNYGQGIFIFLSYMVNRRVANMWLGLCGKQLPLSSTESPKASNDSKQDKKQPVTEEVTLK